MTETWTLESVSGTWSDLVEQFRADQAEAVQWIWCGQDGVKRCSTEHLPDFSPVATHCWGWGASTWYRLRIDGELVTGARLALVPGDSAGSATQVQVKKVRTRGRSDRERSMLDGGAAAEGLRGRPMTAYRVLGGHPLTFMSVDDESWKPVATR